MAAFGGRIAGDGDFRRIICLTVLLGLLARGSFGQCIAETRVAACLTAAGLSIESFDKIVLGHEINPTTYCRNLNPSLVSCLGHAIQRCGSSTLDQAAGKVMELYRRLFVYMCSKTGLSVLIRKGRCLSEPALEAKAVECMEVFLQRGKDVTDMNLWCHLIQNVRACVAIEIDKRCGPEGAAFYDNIFSISLDAVVPDRMLQCNMKASLADHCYPNPCTSGRVCHSPAGHPMCSSGGKTVPTTIVMVTGVLMAFLLGVVGC